MLTEGRARVNGIEIAYLDTGGPGPLALCLHGFPDTPRTWRHLLPSLAAAGYRAVAPWMRSYAPSEIPPPGGMTVGALVADAIALHEVLGGREDAVLVGHDWGALAAYGAAAHAPGRWRRVVAMAVPPSPIIARGLLTYEQLRRSWYLFFFQHAMAEAIVGADTEGFLSRLWQDWSPGYDPDEDLPAVLAAIGQPANLNAALGLYRSTVGDDPADPAYDSYQHASGLPVPQPTLYLHGARDGCIGVALTQGVAGMLGEGSRVEVLLGTGHFAHLEQPAEVNDRILGFLGPGA